MNADERTDIADMTNNWLSASDAARKAEHHYPADCLAEAVIAYRALRHELDTARATIQRVTALADDYHDEYVNAMTDVQSLQEGSRERAEWMANAHRAAEQRDELRAALAPAHDTTEGS